MFKETKPLFLICESPLHVGSGADLGIVDLPIQREKHTGFPKIEASSLKGALREAFENSLVKDENDATSIENLKKINIIFGYDDGELPALNAKTKNLLKELFKDNTQFSGCISISDARLLLFPVKSLHEIFAWITCPRILKRFAQDLKFSNINVNFDIEKISPNSIGKNSKIMDEKKNVHLEEFVFKNLSENENINHFGEWLSREIIPEENTYWKEKIKTDIVVLDDTTFRDFVNLSTEVITRTKIDNITGTVAHGALFTEEYLPMESIMYSLISFTNEFSDEQSRMTYQDVKEFFQQIPAIIQIGGNATLGKGIVRTKILEKNN